MEITIPKGYTVESQPDNISVETKYGKYQVGLQIRDDKIVYYRYYEQHSGRFPAMEYEAVRSFYNRIYDADHTQVVLVRKN